MANRYLPEKLQSERLYFRKLRAEDYEYWLPFHQDPRSNQYWSGLPKNPEIACQEDFDRTLHRYTNDLGGRMALIHLEKEDFVGLCGLLVQTVDGQTELEVGYSILPAFWGQGYASEAAKAIKEYAHSHQLADSLISIIHIDNTPSKKVAVNNGMHLEKNTIYKDNPVEIYRVILR